MKNSGVTQFLLNHQKSKPVSFHMPGHKGEDFYNTFGYSDFLNKIVECDITEIPGADNLFQTEGIIRATMDKYKRLYESKESYLLINGSSAGLIAAIMTAVPEGKQLVVARNCHKSVFNGMTLGRVEPVYAYPEVVSDYGISGELLPEEIEKCLDENPDAEAVILPSPNYYGICSDIKTIAEIVHKRNKILIVDQAHGAHLKFFDKYYNEPNGNPLMSAENLGADIVINSTHKTLASFTQSAIVNINSERVDKYIFEDKLQNIESTSPSYILMASLDINATILEDEAEKLVFQWEDNLKYFYEEASKIKGLHVMKTKLLDHTKINLDMSDYGLNGLELEELLMKDNIYVELVTGDIVMCMTGIGNKRCDFDKLLQSLQTIAANRRLEKSEKAKQQFITQKKWQKAELPKLKTKVKLEDAKGLVCALSIIPYPPGIPLVCPGEILEEECLKYVAELRHKGEKVMGVDDLERVTVGK